MNEDLKLEDRNINNTHSAELKRLHNEDSDRKIESYQRKKEFSIVSYFFFMFVFIMMYLNPIIVGAEYSIVPAIIAFAFSLAIIVFQLLIKDELLKIKILNLLFETCEKI